MSRRVAGPAILDAAWPAPPGVVAFTTLRRGAGVSAPPFDDFNLGAHCGDDPAAVARNRAELEWRFGLPGPPCWLRQVHGTVVHRCDRPMAPRVPVGDATTGSAPHGAPVAPAMRHRPEDVGPIAEPGPSSAAGPLPGLAAPPGRQGGPEGLGGAAGAAGPGGRSPDDTVPEADAAIAAAPGVVLAVLTADCLPVVLAAADGSEVAAVHAGWRGLAAGVLEAALAGMRTPTDRVRAWFGPAAGPSAYEVDTMVRDAFLGVDPRAAAAFAATRPGHWFADLYALARIRLTTAGLAPGDIHGGGECTISDPARFFSHRRDGRGGRMATVVYRER